MTGAFLRENMYEDAKMALHGRLMDLMVTIVPQIYRQHMIYKKEILLLYVTLKRHYMAA